MSSATSQSTSELRLCQLFSTTSAEPKLITDTPTLPFTDAEQSPDVDNLSDIQDERNSHTMDTFVVQNERWFERAT
jgi:hypothetical protein